MIEAVPDIPHELDTLDDDPDARVAFVVDDDQKAAWAMRKLAAVARQVAANERAYRDEVARLDDWLARVNAPLQRDADYFRGLLVAYATDQRDTADRKTIDLPWGRVSTRSTAAKWSVDDDAFLTWARVHAPDLIRVTERPQTTSALKDALAVTGDRVVTGDGEIVPGVTVIPGGVSVTVEPDITT